MTDKALLDMCAEMVRVLDACREKVFEMFDKYGYDAAYFNLDIDLSVKIDQFTARVKEQWEATKT